MEHQHAPARTEYPHAPGREPETEALRAALAARQASAAHLLEFYMSARAERTAARLADTVQRHGQDLAAGRALPYESGADAPAQLARASAQPAPTARPLAPRAPAQQSRARLAQMPSPVKFEMAAEEDVDVFGNAIVPPPPVARESVADEDAGIFGAFDARLAVARGELGAVAPARADEELDIFGART